jgi:hypothetical protein
MQCRRDNAPLKKRFEIDGRYISANEPYYYQSHISMFLDFNTLPLEEIDYIMLFRLPGFEHASCF